MKLDLDLIEFEEYLVKEQLNTDSIYQYVKNLQRFIITNPDIYNIEDYNNYIIEECINKRKSMVYSVLKKYIQFKITDASTRNKLLEKLIRPKTKKNIKRERRYLNETEIFKVFDHITELKHKVISLILHLTGARIGGVMKLKDDKIVFEVQNNKPVMRLAIIDKGNKRNVPYIYDEVAQKIIMSYLEANPTNTGYYFLNLGNMKGREGTLNDINKLYKMNYQWCWRDIKQAIKAAGYRFEDFAPHDYRRCFARRAYLKFDKDIQVLKNLLNHSYVNTTLRYLENSGLNNMDYYKEMQK